MPRRSSKYSPPGRSHCPIVEGSTSEHSGRNAIRNVITGKNPHAVALGRLGGKIGGIARALKLPPEKRKEIARLAAQARWGARDGLEKKNQALQ